MESGYTSRLPQAQGIPGFAAPQELIGRGLEDIRAQLLRATAELEGQLADPAQPLLKDARAQLENHACRIAVVGQVKSGKSTLINALLKSPNLLPTDINPWTAVVTSLHLRGDPPALPRPAAAFHFFTIEEWRDLAEGGGKLRELTERFVPEFKPDRLREQLETMYQRAARRLGPNLVQLLGQCHQYNEITPELLSDYISAGDDSADELSGRPVYSDITRSAELFLTGGPFAFPVTLIDTPGTNDPFLVRDEVTRRSLENPDVYIFTMSALQPLLPADIAMLRLLNGLHKDRIVVFINRVDQLQDPAAHSAHIKTAVENQLRVEFPTLQIPVITGSAWLGQFSDERRIAQLPPQLVAGVIRALRDAGIGRGDHQNTLNASERRHLVTILQAFSGMDAMAATLTRLLSVSNSAILLQHIANNYFELTRFAEISVRAELRSTETAASLPDIAARELRFRKQADSLRASFQQIETSLRDLVNVRVHSIKQGLHNGVQTFAAEEAAVVRQAIEAEHRDKVWVCDVARLRQALEVFYVSAFDQAIASLKEVEGGLYPHLKSVVTALLPDYRDEPIEAPSEAKQVYPAVAPLSDLVTMDLSQSWWKMWLTARRDPEERSNHLRALIETDFQPVVAKLGEEAERQLMRRVDHTMKKMQVVSDSLLAAAERRGEGDALLVEQHAPAELTAQAELERRQRRVVSAKRLADLVATGNQVRELLRKLDLLWIENSGS